MIIKHKILKKLIKTRFLVVSVLMIAVAFWSCDPTISAYEFDLPEAGSIADATPPKALFTYSQAASSDDDAWKNISFANQSSSATTYSWDFGGGNTSDEKEPTFIFDGEGTFPVTLTASDALGASDSVTIDVIVEEGPYQPIIVEPGFEDNTLPDGTGDGRDSWRNSDLGGVIQITSSPVSFGDQAAKLPSDQSRVGYQEITVVPDTNYSLRFWYTMKDDSSDPWVKVTVLGVTDHGGTFETPQDALDGTIGSVTVNDITDPEEYLQTTLTFNSGANSTVAIYFYNGPVEARLDDFTIEPAPEGAVPPSVGFSFEQSSTNYLEYTFTNSSTGATSYEWDFGDGNTSTEESPTHVYATHNIYTVTLTAMEGSLSSTLSQTIDIQAPVTADFTYMVDPSDYRTYTFTDASEGAVMLLWEFGDGYQFTGMDPSHTYADDGIYTVSLTAYSVTDAISVATAELVVSQGFVVQVLNGTFDLYGTTPGCTGESTGDNADAWDMTPNSTIKDCDGNDIPSPYDPLWDNGALDSWLEGFYGDGSEQAGSTSDGNNGTRGAKLGESGRRLYQVVTVQQGMSYNFSIDTRSEAMGVNTEVFILNTEIPDEVGINASTSDSAIDAYFEITNDFNTDNSVFVTSNFTFTASTGEIVIYVRSVDAVDSSNEVFIDNIEINEN